MTSALHRIWYALRRWRLVSRKVPSLACMTTPCPTVGWPPVTWKGSGAHVALSVQAGSSRERLERLLPD
ncbi:unnamed protein product [Spirodela intermedia]|uniref:Uncharacterized protein n=1 Tax=Spirodela intermedia TaxID=51605 RepID=A0A7I8JZ04_SPIIN|nr:unnamed protein product [Spirodela intermedia]